MLACGSVIHSASYSKKVVPSKLTGQSCIRYTASIMVPGKGFVAKSAETTLYRLRYSCKLLPCGHMQGN